MQIADFITEGRDAILYHGTPLDHALIILASNTINTGIEWHGEGQRVSLTRSMPVAIDFGNQGEFSGPPVVFSLDQRKLSQRFKMRPYADHNSSGIRWSDEQEEMVFGNINPLNRYLVSISARPSDLRGMASDSEYLESVLEKWEGAAFFSTPEQVSEAILRLLDHPLFNRILG